MKYRLDPSRWGAIEIMSRTRYSRISPGLMPWSLIPKVLYFRWLLHSVVASGEPSCSGKRQRYRESLILGRLDSEFLPGVDNGGGESRIHGEFKIGPKKANFAPRGEIPY